MKLLPILLVGAAATVGGVYLYRRGKRQLATSGTAPTLAGTLTAGVRDLVAVARASTPSSGDAATAAGTPRTAAGDPILGQTAVRHTRFRLSRLRATAPLFTDADAFAQGIN